MIHILHISAFIANHLSTILLPFKPQYAGFSGQKPTYKYTTIYTFRSDTSNCAGILLPVTNQSLRVTAFCLHRVLGISEEDKVLCHVSIKTHGICKRFVDILLSLLTFPKPNMVERGEHTWYLGGAVQMDSNGER